MEQLNNLKRLPRTGWLLCNVPLSEVEDVAQHSFDVAAITLLLADELERLSKKVNKERALSMAVLHDWAEAEVGDFPYPALKHLGPSGKRRMERSALKELLKGRPDRARYLVLWQEYRDKNTPESKLVHAADYLSMLLQAIKYKERGIRSRRLDELWRAVKKDLTPYVKEFRPVREFVAELGKRWPVLGRHS